jgi:acetoin utilization deacetylase AcuC-like enzyme
LRQGKLIFYFDGIYIDFKDFEVMTSLLVSHPQGFLHLTPNMHPEGVERLVAVNKALSGSLFHNLDREVAQSVDLEIISLAHSEKVLEKLRDARPAEGIGVIDEDTFISAHSFDAVASGVGAGLRVLEAVMEKEVDNGFCATRPPGHHAEIDRSMGFCLVNNIAIVARYAQKHYGVERVAIVDFDVHHGNGTQDIFFKDASVFYASSHQGGIFPNSGKAKEIGVGNIVNCELSANSDGVEMREAYIERILPALRNFAPDIILISAGFDAHRRDPLAQLNWEGTDFAWVTGKLMDIAEEYCNNRIVSMLEGGYDLHGLADGVKAHMLMLKNGSFDGV